MEENTKEHEIFVYYLQWNGNEEQLTLLRDILSKQSWDDLGCEHCKLSIDIEHKLTEQVVDTICRTHKGVSFNCYHKMFTKCLGKFYSPIKESDIEGLDEYEIGRLVDETFWTCKVPKMFSGYRNPYAELLDRKITREEYERIKDDY